MALPLLGSGEDELPSVPGPEAEPAIRPHVVTGQRAQKAGSGPDRLQKASRFEIVRWTMYTPLLY